MINQKSGEKNMTDSLISEYNTMKKRYKKLVLEGKKLQKEHDADVKYFIDNHIINGYYLNISIYLLWSN